MCSGGGRYTPRYHPSPLLPEPPQCVGTPMFHPVAVWVPCPPSAVPPGGRNTRGISPARGSLPKSMTQTEVPLAPPPHKISLTLSYLLPPSPKVSSVIPTFLTPSVGSVPPPPNCCQKTKMFVPSTRTKELPSEVYHTPMITSPSVPLYHHQPAHLFLSDLR